jgi:hypothetical protein
MCCGRPNRPAATQDRPQDVIRQSLTRQEAVSQNWVRRIVRPEPPAPTPSPNPPQG